jgi:hypothetical protein
MYCNLLLPYSASPFDFRAVRLSSFFPSWGGDFCHTLSLHGTLNISNGKTYEDSEEEYKQLGRRLIA